jgi:hypothetical protein
MKIWFKIERATLGRDFDVNPGDCMCQCSARWNMCTISAFALGPRKTTENLDKVGEAWHSSKRHKFSSCFSENGLRSHQNDYVINALWGNNRSLFWAPCRTYNTVTWWSVYRKGMDWSLSLIHTLSSSLQHVCLLSLLCLHQSLSGNGFQRHKSLNFRVHVRTGRRLSH